VVYIGLDDTDTSESPGTGYLARLIAADLDGTYHVAGVTRHQLLVDPRVPYTAKNSSAAILLAVDDASLSLLERRVTAIILAHYAASSDPGLAIAAAVPEEVVHFGRRVQREVVSQDTARRLAAAHHVVLVGLGGNHDGVIGALAAVGLVAGGDDGRYVQVGRSRDLQGMVPVAQLLAAGIAEVRTTDNQPVTGGRVLADRLRPARREGRPILYVRQEGDTWLPLKLD